MSNALSIMKLTLGEKKQITADQEKKDLALHSWDTLSSREMLTSRLFVPVG